MIPILLYGVFAARFKPYRRIVKKTFFLLVFPSKWGYLFSPLQAAGRGIA